MGADADLVRRLTEEGFLKGNPGIVDELLADDFVSHDPPPGVRYGSPGLLEGQVEDGSPAVTDGAQQEPALEFLMDVGHAAPAIAQILHTSRLAHLGPTRRNTFQRDRRRLVR